MQKLGQRRVRQAVHERGFFLRLLCEPVQPLHKGGRCVRERFR